jgi:outer membrane lipoprotein-sorting protein
MMRFYILYISFLIIETLNASGQSDQAAINILDKFAANATGAPSISMKFNFVTIDQAENAIDTLKGSVILSKDKYQLNLPDNIIWFNGETSWSYLPAEKEVTINKADKKDNSFQNRPSAIFSMYKSDYKCRLIEERSDSYIIDLYPEDIKSDILRVRISIGKQLMNLRSLEYKQKDGIIKTLNVTDYDLKQKPGPESFVFPQAKYKGVEVIDMR